jgi:regulator of protease activity HflC (stomatin/prohibitin superfamily)
MSKKMSKKMSKGSFILGAIVLVFASMFLINSCERIDAGHVGVKVDMYGSGKGVNDVAEVTGWVFYNPITTKIYEFPTFIQHKEYTGDNSFVVNSKDGSEFSVSPIMNYSVQREKVPAIFAKYRRSLSEIEEGFLKTAVYDAFRLATNKYTADGLIGNREVFEIEVRKLLESQLLKEGFVINQFTSNLVYPDSFKKAINAKNNAQV